MGASSNSFTDLKLVLDAKAILGEGSFWNHETKRLWWVDIEGKKLHIYDPVEGENKSIEVGQRIGTVVPSEKGGAIVALQNGIFHLDLESENLNLIANPIKGKPNIRFNDGKCDPAGRLWVGTMELDTKEKAASLYRLDLDGKVDEVLENVTISNGIIWSNDNKTMYYTDTATQKVIAFDFEQDQGNISNGRTIIEIPIEMGSPDGMTIDTEGNLWIALYGGFCVARFDVETGKLLQKIQLPAPNATSCAFGGGNFDILYITTAREGMEDDMLEKYPLSGGLFSIVPGINGVPLHFFKGNF